MSKRVVVVRALAICLLAVAPLITTACATLGDKDGDGIKRRDDQCPDLPEDMNGVDDTDGCPDGTPPTSPTGAEREGGERRLFDGDGDGDGVSDSNDACPDNPEDFDDFEDSDGCPDPDNDRDGILDVDDKCPNEPEDRDGFEDEDGCPESDNDRDGVPDSMDACPMESGGGNTNGCPASG